MRNKKTSAFEIRAAGTALDLLIFGVIGETWDDSGVTAKDVAEALKDKKITAINVSINSAGGRAIEGIAIYNLLSQHKARVIVTIEGMALSAASIIAMSGDEIRMAENALMMIHNASTYTFGNAADHMEMAALLGKADTALVKTYAARTGQSEEQIAEWLAAETWLDATEAMDSGFATSIIEAKKIAACGDLSRFRNVPSALLAAIENNAAGAAGKAVDAMSEKDIEKARVDARAEVVAEEQVRIANLEAAFPGEPEFVMAQVKAGHDVTNAKAEWADVLAERLVNSEKALADAKAAVPTKKPELPGVDDAGGGGSGGSGADGGDVIAKWQDGIRAKMESGMSMSNALMSINKENPGLRQAYVAAFNADPARRVE